MTDNRTHLTNEILTAMGFPSERPDSMERARQCRKAVYTDFSNELWNRGYDSRICTTWLKATSKAVQLDSQMEKTYGRPTVSATRRILRNIIKHAQTDRTGPNRAPAPNSSVVEKFFRKAGRWFSEACV